MTKRAAPILILAMLALSILPVLPAQAVTVTEITIQEKPYTVVTEGVYGDDLAVVGGDVTAGVDVNIYWDAVKAWDGEKGLLNSTEAGSDGSYVVWFEVPEAVAGKHYLWAKDTDTGETEVSDFFTVESLVEVSSSSGLPGDKITVDGYGFGDEKDIAVLLTDVPVPGGTPATESIGTADNFETEFSDDLTNTPIEPDTVEVDGGTAGTLFDNGDGTLDTGGVGIGTINYVTGEIEVTFDSAPTGYGSIDCNYDYFKDVADTVYVFTTAPDSNDLGSFSRVVTLPALTAMDYDQTLYLYAFDDVDNEDTAVFAIGAVITVDVDEGPTGTVVEIRGEGFDDAEDIDAGDIVITGDGVTDVACYIDEEPVDIEAPDGDFKLDIVIPTVSDIDDYDKIEVTDAVGKNTAAADFTVTGDAEIEVEPEFALPGERITISGYNFTAISDEDVVVELWDEWPAGSKVVDLKTFETDSDGEFSGKATVPAGLDYTSYDLVAKQTDYSIDADTGFRVGLMTVIPVPDDEGPTGMSVILTASGFTDDGAWNATLGDVAIFEDMTAEPDGDISEQFYVPTVPVGTYAITVFDIEAEIEVTTEFEVTDTTFATIDPVTAPNDYNVTIEGWYFTTIDEGSLEFVIFNETDDWDMDVLQGDPGDDAETNEDGNFTAWWEVPDKDTLDIGEYTINVTSNNPGDGPDLFAQIAFRLVAETIAIRPRKTQFAIGETVSFIIESSFTLHNSYIEIDDPKGNLYWTTDKFTDGSDNTDDLWVKVGVLQVLPYYSQTAGGNPMIMLDDAPLGTWSWTYYDEDDEELDSGSFTVSAAPAIVLEERMGELEAVISGLSGDVSDLSGDVSGLSDDVAGLKTAISAAEAAADAANAAAKSAADAISDVADTAADAKTAADAAKSSADAAKTAADDAKSAAGGLSSLVWGAIIASIVAALVGIFSLMQISRRIAG